MTDELKELIKDLRHAADSSVQHQSIAMSRDELISLLDRITELEQQLAKAKLSYTELFDAGIENLTECHLERDTLREQLQAARDALTHIIAECDASVSCPHCQQDFVHMDSCPIGKAKDIINE